MTTTLRVNKHALCRANILQTFGNCSDLLLSLTVLIYTSIYRQDMDPQNLDQTRRQSKPLIGMAFDNMVYMDYNGRQPNSGNTSQTSEQRDNVTHGM